MTTASVSHLASVVESKGNDSHSFLFMRWEAWVDISGPRPHRVRLNGEIIITLRINNRATLLLFELGERVMLCIHMMKKETSIRKKVIQVKLT